MCNLSVIQLLALVAGATALSERALVARGRLFEALSSPSGKLTLSPEIIIPEPSNPTAILLQATAITAMSVKMRTQAKANAALLSGAVTSVRTFCNEQEQARGNFPGPVPAIYCGVADDLSALSDAGVEGLLVAVCGGSEISSVDDVAADTKWADVCKAALESGLQPIPEVTMGEATAASWKGDDIEALVAKITEIAGEAPISVLLTVNQVPLESDDEDEEEKEVSLPEVPKSLGKKIPILGSVRVKAGEGRMGQETSRFKAAGFTGAFLRQECNPAIAMNQDLEFVAGFWSSCIGDLKSLKSKSFQFQTKNYLSSSAPLEWMKYQKSIVESGALGEQADNVPTGTDPGAGDYQGF
jgi:hypothetical protein